MAHGPEDYRLEERPVPRPGPGEVLIKVQSTGVCASDIKCYTGAALFWGDEHRVGYCQAPVTPGHEFVGTVVGLGDGPQKCTDSKSVITPSANRLFHAGTVGTASPAPTGCATSTIFTDFVNEPLDLGPTTCFFLPVP